MGLLAMLGVLIACFAGAVMVAAAVKMRQVRVALGLEKPLAPPAPPKNLRIIPTPKK
jgi:hypothetical protein